MSANFNKKVCWNCETIVDLTQENCQSCSVYLSPTSLDDHQNNYNILIPPYNVKEDEESNLEEPIFNSKECKPEIKSDPSNIKFVLATMGLLFLGSIFILFSSLLFIFSQNGTLTMQWDANYWYVYLGFAFPLLFLGWRGLESISD